MDHPDTKVTTVRLPATLAEEVDEAAEVLGVTASELIRQALFERIARLRADPEFQARLRRHAEENARVLERLAG